MKAQIFALSTMTLLATLAPLHARATDNDEAPSFVSFVARIQSEFTEQDEHLFLAITDDAAQIAEAAAESAACATDADFKDVASEEWGGGLMNELADAYLRIGDMDDGYYSFMEMVDGAMHAYTADVLGKRALTICTDHSVPAYSDGHTQTFLKADGAFVLMHEVGAPD
jgi:hypothetical protein